MATAEVYFPGLEGAIAGETAISTVEGGLRYRGYPVTELAEKATFEEVAHLLLHGELPNTDQLQAFQKRVAAARQIPESLRNLLRSIPADTVPMDALRSAVSVLAHFDPETADCPTPPMSARRSGCSARSPWPSPINADSARGCRSFRRVPILSHAG